MRHLFILCTFAKSCTDIWFLTFIESSEIRMSNAYDQLTELELRIATLIRKYGEVRKALDVKSQECDALLAKEKTQEEKIRGLEQSLSIATVATSQSPEARSALESLEKELDGITQVIDECITLLDGRIE